MVVVVVVILLMPPSLLCVAVCGTWYVFAPCHLLVYRGVPLTDRIPHPIQQGGHAVPIYRDSLDGLLTLKIFFIFRGVVRVNRGFCQAGVPCNAQGNT